MADTPDQGAAWTAAIESHSAVNAAHEALQAEPDNEELKTAHTTAQTTADEARTAYDGFFPENPSDWPDDWRNIYVNGIKGTDGKDLNEEAKGKLSKRLERYASPQSAFDAMISAQNKISSGQLTNKLTADSTPDEIAEWRKENDVPEEAKGYTLTLAEGLVIGDNDKEMVDGFLATAHESNFSQGQVSQALNWYYGNQEKVIETRHQADAEHKQKVEEELRQEWGAEYQPNRNLMANYLGTAPDGVAELIVGARLADGTPFGNHPGVVKFFVDKAREANPAGALVPGSGEKQLEAIADEIAALEKIMGTDEWKKDPAKQERYLKLIAARDKVPIK